MDEDEEDEDSLVFETKKKVRKEPVKAGKKNGNAEHLTKSSSGASENLTRINKIFSNYLEERKKDKSPSEQREPIIR